MIPKIIYLTVCLITVLLLKSVDGQMCNELNLDCKLTCNFGFQKHNETCLPICTNYAEVARKPDGTCVEQNKICVCDTNLETKHFAADDGLCDCFYNGSKESKECIRACKKPDTVPGITNENINNKALKHRLAEMEFKLIEKVTLLGIITGLTVVQGWELDITAEEESGRDYMKTLDELTSDMKNRLIVSNWNYEKNLTKFNENIMLKTVLEVAEEDKQYWEETTSYRWQEFQNEDLKRMFQKYSALGTSALPEDLNQKFVQAINNMKSNYATASICDFKDRDKCDLHLEPEVTDIFTNSRDPEELKFTWIEWHKAAGAPSKGNYTEYVDISNKTAQLNGFETAAEWWLDSYESSDIEEQFASLWNQIQPLYEQMHAYVRRKLREKYGEDIVSARGPIPAHLLGNVWAQNWESIESFSRPYPDKKDIDITSALKEQNYTALRFFKTAEEFFTSLNLQPMPKLFWERSLIEKPDDGRKMVCHPYSYDFYDKEDYRIRQCTKITNDFFQITHHEMGHIQYYLQYKDLPVIYRDGANPGFHEAVGDVIALSVTTPKHLRAIGLLKEGPEDLESNINQLYKMGLSKIAFLPFSYLVDIWRYSVFRGTTTPDDYNCHFWQLKEGIQGVEPPITRTEEDFDPAAKFHVGADVEYTRYYIALIIQFQFQRSLCYLAGQYVSGDPDKLLSNCDIYRSTEAGDALSKMLQMGSSKPWPDAMEALTGQRYMDAGGLMEYFQPLYDWLNPSNV